MFYFSKSKYCDFCDCQKLAWLNRYKPEEYCISDSTKARMEMGSIVGDIAMGYFGDSVEVTERNGERLDLAKMIERTKQEIAKNTPVICEASFEYNGLYCAVDILKKENGGWAIYEVKSSTHTDKPRYINDVAYQKYVLEKCGINVTGTYVMCLNNQYIYDGKNLDIQQLFRYDDVSESVAKKLPEVEGDLERAKSFLEDKNEPSIPLGLQCENPGDCAYWGYCTRNLPKPNVFDLYRTSMKNKCDLYNRGLVDIASLEGEPTITGEIQKRQIDFALHDKGTYVNKEEISKFLDTLEPLYFLDFESVQPAVPKYAGTKPYTQVPFQYSLHYIEKEGGELKHKEFLAQAGTDPLRDIAEALCRDIPADACVTAYNKAFECTRIKELAGYFPDLSAHLLSIFDNIVDLLIPFQSGWYYNREMGGSFSIKSVLPALFPCDPSLDYHSLNGIHNGGEAMNAFPAMEKMSGEELEQTRKNLLEYCKLDTFAMVKVWEKLREAII